MKHLWHIDDSADDRFLVGTLLRVVDPEVNLTGFAYGREAWAVLAQTVGKDPDLVLLDLNMPDMNGLEFLQEVLNHRDETINVVVLTSSDSELERKKAYELGARRVVQKPFNLEEYKLLLTTILQEYA